MVNTLNYKHSDWDRLGCEADHAGSYAVVAVLGRSLGRITSEDDSQSMV